MQELIGRKYQYRLLPDEKKTVAKVQGDTVIFVEGGMVPLNRLDEMFLEIKDVNSLTVESARKMLTDEPSPENFFESRHESLLKVLKQQAEKIDTSNMPAPVMATNTTLDGTQSDGGPVRKIIVETDDSGKTIGSHEEKPVPTGVDFFKKMKRTTDAKINIKFVEKIPNVDFIKMMDENFDQGVLDYLVQNITDNIIAAPNIIHNQVRAQLHDMVYAKKDKVKKNAAQDQK